MDFELRLDTRDGELRPLHNEAGSASTRENVLEYDPDPFTMFNVRIETVQYGTYDSKPAALIVFKFIARFRSGSRRIKNFHIDIKFDNQAQLSLPAPRVIKFKPDDVRGKLFTQERSNTLSAGLDVPLGPSGASLRVSDEIAQKINREYEVKLTGWLTGAGPGIDNVLVWDCAEARKAGRGVVPNYCGACIVRYNANERFVATFKLDAERGAFRFDKHVFEYVNVFGQKQIDDPVIFNPDEPIGRQYTNVATLDAINLDDIVKLTPIATLPQGYS